MMVAPKLRFKADDGSEFPAWEERAFWDVFANLTNNTLSRECLNRESGQARNIHYGDVLVKYGAVVDVQKDGVPFVNPDVECKRWDCLKNGDVVIADTAEDETVGKAVEISNAGSDIVYSGLHTIACRPKEEFAPGYLGNYINSMSYHDQLRPYMQGIKVTSVSKTNIGLTHLLVPSLPEQRKIADFLSAVDDVIAAQEAEVDAWEQRKKGVMQKLFSQEVRFKADDGSEFPAWEKKTLGDLGVFVRGLTYDKTQTVETNGVAVMRSNNISSDGTLDYENEVQLVSKEPSKEQLLRKNDIVICMANGSDRLVGKAAKYDGGYKEPSRITVGAFCGIFRSSAPALPWWFQSDEYQRFLYLGKQGGNGALANLKGKDIENISVMFPADIDEQRKISDCLASMDEVIQKSKGELAKWRELKKGLLQQMFV